MARADLAGRVRRLFSLPRADVDGLIAGATVLAFPSRYEGFGLPLVEAMVAGCPVIASATAAMPEIVGDAGILVAPDDVAGWAAALERLVCDADERSRLARLGQARATRFGRAATGRALLGAHRHVMGLTTER
jgi:alpha-1,3-rhamnosyl/mannosyltransferase